MHKGFIEDAIEAEKQNQREFFDDRFRKLLILKK
jgi:hypothetical protein